MTDTSSLRAFIEARLDEDERLAMAAVELDPSPWFIRDQDGAICNKEGFTVVHIEDSTPEPATAEHIARHDPARVLREVAAKRALLAQHQAVCDEVHQPLTAEHRMNARARQYQLEQVLPLLALPFADHPDYRTEWSTA